MEAWERRVEESESVLTDLDRAIGDGDHGVNMRRGMSAVTKGLAVFTPPDLPGHLRAISILLTSSVGGASGPLYGAYFLQASRAVANKSELGLIDLVALFEAGCQGVVQLGKATVGDKTMVDTLAAAAGSLRTAHGRRESLPEGLTACALAAGQAARGTVPMIARKGRASYLGERSAGVEDPGAASACLLVEALAQVVSHSFPIRTSTHPSSTVAL
jgi:dihydroxyacetone kinase-like protein